MKQLLARVALGILLTVFLPLHLFFTFPGWVLSLYHLAINDGIKDTYFEEIFLRPWMAVLKGRVKNHDRS